MVFIVLYMTHQSNISSGIGLVKTIFQSGDFLQLHSMSNHQVSITMVTPTTVDGYSNYS